MRSEPLSAKTLERLRERLTGVGDGDWLFSQIADRVASRRAELGIPDIVDGRDAVFAERVVARPYRDVRVSS